MKEEYNQLVALFGSLDIEEQGAILQDLRRVYQENSKPKLKNYVSAMEKLVGYPITGKGHERHTAYARAVVAKVMSDDGFGEPYIGQLLNRHHSTVHHYKTLMNTAFKCPRIYFDLIELYNQYIQLI